MSWNPTLDPTCPTGDEVDAIETLIIPRARDLGGFEVRRALPAPKRQMVGPFIFFDQMGPAEFLPARGMDVRPHPHIGLATITYLYRGRMHHRDSLGTDAWIEPGAVNWMVAGHGITHSERTDDATQTDPMPFFGIQTWVALPDDAEDAPAAFEHAPKDTLPLIADGRHRRAAHPRHRLGRTRAGLDLFRDVLCRRGARPRRAACRCPMTTRTAASMSSRAASPSPARTSRPAA